MLKTSLLPDQATTFYVKPASFTKTNTVFSEKIGYQTGRGFIVKKYPIYPQRKLQGWQTNTFLELSQIVYPDGSLRNASAAQERLAAEKEQALASAKIGELRSRAAITPPGAALQAIQQQIDELESKYFPDRQRHAQANAQHADVMNEMKDNRAAVGGIQVSVDGHARNAEAQRQGILNELKLLVAQGLVSGRIPTAPPLPGAASSAPPLSGAASTAPPKKAPVAFPVPSSPTTTAPPSTMGSTASSPALSQYSTLTSATGAIASSFPEEAKILDSIETAVQTKFSNFDEIISTLTLGSLSKADQAQLSILAAGELDRLDNRSKSKAVIDYMTQIALIQAGGNPADFRKVKIPGQVKKLSTIKDNVKDYLRKI